MKILSRHPASHLTEGIRPGHSPPGRLRSPGVASRNDVLSVIAALPRGVDAVVVRDGARTIVAASPVDLVTASGADALDALDRIDRSEGWWAGFLSYDLGRQLEPVSTAANDDVGIPDLVFARFDARLVFEVGRHPTIEGHGPTRRLLDRARHDAGAPRLARLSLDSWSSSLDPVEWADRVAAIIELLTSGDCYQVNLTRRLTCPTGAEPRSLFAALSRTSPAPHAALIDLRHNTGIAVASASPERFLARADDLVETRPVKGTHREAAHLVASEKDRAENVMIVDLARNDLGRVCRFGTVEVAELCALEHHPGLHHLVSTVHGRLRPETSLRELVAATFPPASVTGAPKPRVLQAIEDLEPVRRGVYCGAVGWVDAGRNELDLNVAIRTFTVTTAATHLGIGSGIVADSTADAEWDETCLKAHRLLHATGAHSASRTGR